MRRYTLAIACAALSLTAACADSAPTDNGGGGTTNDSLTTALVASGLHAPTFLTAPAGDTGRLFILEQNGYVRIIEHGVLLPNPFLDIHTLVTHGSEQGLLGLAFYPDYATSGRFIISYTSPTGTEDGGTSVLARYAVSASPNVANPVADSVLLRFDQPYTNHNGGMIVFGPDGYLYAGFGDGGSGGDPQGHAQDRTDLLGSMLRLDVSGAGEYTIPADNPYATSDSFRRELWSYGLRNPWRFSFDRSTGDLYIGDVGQDAVEEVDLALAGTHGGENYGWNQVEGNQCFTTGCHLTDFTAPIQTYSHASGCAIIGGYVYRGNDIAGLAGTYFYSDACSGFVRSFKWSAGSVSGQQSWPDLAGHGGVQSFGEDARGELYILTGGGSVYRIVKQ
ncbi:MAG: PQQ-dependent sugar dehydrogenase [Gemmatimonadota bacterium]